MWRPNPNVKSIVIVLVLVLGGRSAFGVDGVTDINQARALAGGVSPDDTAGFPVTISQSGSYRLTGNLTTPNLNTTAIVVSAPFVTIDLNGFGIFGGNTCSGSPTSCGSGTSRGVDASGAQDVTVLSGAIVGMGAEGINIAYEGRVEGVTLKYNGTAGVVLGSAGIVSGNRIYQNGGNGITTGGSSVTVSGNVIELNAVAGMDVDHGTISGNTVDLNGLDGIVLREAGVISNNTVHGNGRDGLYAGAATVIGNTVNQNGEYGIHVPVRFQTGNGAGPILNNTLMLNTSVGIFLDSTALAGYAGNVLTGNNGNNSQTGGFGTLKSLGSNICNNAACP